MPSDVSLSRLLELEHADEDIAVHYDRYPSLDNGNELTSVADELDRALARLPREQRLAVEAVVVAGLSYRDAAKWMGLWTKGKGGRLPDGKRVHRSVVEGLERLRGRLLGSAQQELEL